ncbi:hypothetical protein MKW92_007122 [Papaver armeniacum]|nr:hypothetical protein MKW92_007122 [Papaver armeniacum]
MEGKQVFVPRRSPRITEQTRIQELIETSTEHSTKMDMINERKTKCCHDLDPDERSHDLQ